MYPQVFGKYVLERELARGGMARVLLATLRGAGGFEKKLVVKQIRDELALDTDFVQRFVQEAKTTVSLSHPNIVPVYELGVEQGTYFLAMELVEGASLAEILEGEHAKEPLTPEQGAYVGIEICRALDYAHRRMQVIHRDITPRNVMVDDEGQIKLIDFGIAARAQGGTEDGRVFGSPGHMPPEQIEGRELGPATDLFAVGVLLMELWSGKAPFRRKTPEACAEAMSLPHPKPSEANARLSALDDIIASAMALSPDKRPQTADDLGRALRRFLADVDLGDVARSLGHRAHDARDRVSKRADAKTITLPRQPSHAEHVTKTFAARDEVMVDPPSSRDPSSATAEAGTRRLTSERPPRVSEPRVETIATRPIETPIRGFLPASSDGLDSSTNVAVTATRKRSSLPWIVGGGVALVGAILGLRTTREGRSAAPRVEPTATATVSAARPEPSSTSTTMASVAPVIAPKPTLSAAPSVEPPSEARTPARLSIFCDPGTRVTVDGAARGSCPLRDLSVEPGAHEVRFVFEPTGESRGERIHVAAGKRITLRADFTGSTPLVRVER